jgi:general secretion pathway protein D
MMSANKKNRKGRHLNLAALVLMLLLPLGLRAQIVPALQPDELRSLKFVNTPLDLVLDEYSDLTGRTLIKSQGINATITLKSRTRLTHTEALMAIESALQMYNIGLVPMGDKFLKVVQTANVRTSGMPIEMTIPEEGFSESDKLVSQVVDLQHIEISEAQPILDQLKHAYGKIQPLDRTNSLLITDTSQNLNRMLEILSYIDRPAAINEDIFVREIKFSKASEIASKLNELIQDSQSDQSDQERIAPPTSTTPSAPTATTPPGVIRARQAAIRAGQQQAQAAATTTASGAAELAERGIIQGKVRIVADDRTGILFIISRPENFAFFDQIISVLDQPITPSFEVRVIAMEYADAEEVSGILNEFIGAASAEEGTATTASDNADDDDGDSRSQALRDFVQARAQQAASSTGNDNGETEPADFGRLSAETKIIADPRTNSLMLMGKTSDIVALEELIDQLDIMLGQVMIEAVILEVLLDDGVNYGVDWLQRSFTVNNDETVGPGGGLTISQPVAAFGGGQNFSGRESFIDGGEVGRSTAISSAISYYFSLYDLNLDAVITMAANSSDAKILSTPVILTADNTEANIIVGEERPVVSTTSTTDSGTIRSSFEYRNIGINLTVTPRINPERFVVMEITQTADDVGGEVQIDGNLVPIITKREFSAQVAVNNRETIVLGGLVRNSERESLSKVPILGDIPILGTLFRSSTMQEQRTELLVLITPYVMMTPDEVRTETSRLHDATQLKRVGWERGWSDSQLAEEPKKSWSEKRKEKKRDRRKAGDVEKDTTEPKVSSALVYPEDLIDEPAEENVSPEVIIIESSPEPSEIPPADEVVPMYAPESDKDEAETTTTPSEDLVVMDIPAYEGPVEEMMEEEIVKEPASEPLIEKIPEKQVIQPPPAESRSKIRELRSREPVMPGPPGF